MGSSSFLGHSRRRLAGKKITGSWEKHCLWRGDKGSGMEGKVHVRFVGVGHLGPIGNLTLVPANGLAPEGSRGCCRQEAGSAPLCRQRLAKTAALLEAAAARRKRWGGDCAYWAPTASAATASPPTASSPTEASNWSEEMPARANCSARREAPAGASTGAELTPAVFSLRS